jgi:hypothetical protein
MSTFKEVEVNSHQFFKEVRLILEVTPHINGASDWFDHEKFREKDLPRLQAIQPPYNMIKFKQAEKEERVIDLDAEEVKGEKPRLLPERAK